MNAGQSPLGWAAREQKAARKGVRRKLLAWVGLNKAAVRAGGLAVRAAYGAEGEQQTAALLGRLPAGWKVWHGQRLPGFKSDLDHVLVSPCGTAVVVLDSKRWHAQWVTHLRAGRVFCGEQDRHGQIEAVGKYAARLQEALALPGVVVWPLLVVHGSRIDGGRLEVRVPKWSGTVHVLGPDWLVPTLASAPKALNPARAAAVAARVNQVLVSAAG